MIRPRLLAWTATVAIIYGLLAPARTPEPVINRLHTELVQLRQSGAAAEKFSSVGVEVVAGSPAELAAVMKSEMTRVGKLIKDAGIRSQ